MPSTAASIVVAARVGAQMRAVGTVALLWGAGAALYAVVEALTNAVTGLSLPARVLLPVLLIYAAAGTLAGAVVGVLLAAWRRWGHGGPIRTAPFAIAAFHPLLTLVYVGLRINDRLLPDLVAPRSIVVNLVLLAAFTGVLIVLHRQLRALAGGALALAFVCLATAFGLFVSVALHLDTFVAPDFLRARSVLLYSALALGCGLLYVASYRGLRALASRGRWSRMAGGTAAVGALVLGLWGSHSRGSVAGTAGPGEAPNIVWVVLDTLRRDHLSAYGYTRPTSPNLEAIAREGALFDAAIAGSSCTVPSHFQMITSRFAAGTRGVLGDRFETAAELLRKRGYATGAVLANPGLGRGGGFEQGFETFVDGPAVLLYLEVLEKLPFPRVLLRLGLPARTVLRLFNRKVFITTGKADGDVITGHVLTWLDARAAAPSPFFLFVNYLDPHDPYDPPAPFRQRFAPAVDPERGFVRYDARAGRFISSEEFVRDVAPHLGAADWSELTALYDGDIAFVDAQLGAIVARLKALGLYDRTMLIVNADHGELFGEHGLAQHMKSLSDEEIRVPLLMRYPTRIPAGRRVAEPVELVDILPTVLDVLAIQTAEAMDGRSVLPLFADRGPASARSETHSYLLRRPDPEFPHTAAGHLVALRTATAKYVWSSTGRDELYDLRADPDAARNRYGETTEASEMSRKATEWRKLVGLDAAARPRRDKKTEQRLRSLGYVP